MPVDGDNSSSFTMINVREFHMVFALRDSPCGLVERNVGGSRIRRASLFVEERRVLRQRENEVRPGAC